MARIDTVTETVTTVQVGDFPTAVAVGHGSVWVANAGDGTVSRIDPETRRIVATIRLGASPEGDRRRDRVVLVATSAGLETQVGGKLLLAHRKRPDRTWCRRRNSPGSARRTSSFTTMNGAIGAACRIRSRSSNA